MANHQMIQFSVLKLMGCEEKIRESLYHLLLATLYHLYFIPEIHGTFHQLCSLLTIASARSTVHVLLASLGKASITGGRTVVCGTGLKAEPGTK